MLSRFRTRLQVVSECLVFNFLRPLPNALTVTVTAVLSRGVCVRCAMSNSTKLEDIG